ncbi:MULTISPECIES: hypothetical protein [unclassified Streptomyces]|uniref:hypothetical protein n=1 Tax=unclassified Streptomyces TaxID=2593676 RepID=UPI0036E16881
MTTPADDRVLAEPGRYAPETLADWLLARNRQRRAQLTAACESLRADIEARTAAHERLAALVTAAARTAT